MGPLPHFAQESLRMELAACCLDECRHELNLHAKLDIRKRNQRPERVSQLKSEPEIRKAEPETPQEPVTNIEPVTQADPAIKAADHDEYAKILGNLIHDHLSCKVKQSLSSSKDYCGYQLLYAAQVKCIACVKHLINQGVDKSLNQGYTALDFASWEDNEENSDVELWLWQHGGIPGRRSNNWKKKWHLHR